LANWTYFYLIHIEFLGFRYHGWQKQANTKSVHGMIDKTFDFIFDHANYRTLGCGRTDAKVSADDYALELFTNEEQLPEQLLERLNLNLPSDIRAKSVKAVSADFNVIQSARTKEYHYYFSSGEKSHPYNAPFIRDFGKQLSMENMEEAVKFFEGRHNFKRYASKPSAETVLVREILSATIEPNTKFTGQFAPQNAFVFKVKAKGFLRYQVRLMMGALVEVGRGIWSADDLRQSLIEYDGLQIRHIAPSSGLVLHKVDFEDAISS
jgi:tRNA pseudouridine38-40 synthase